MSDERVMRIPLDSIARLRLVFPAERIVHGSRGIDRTTHMPSRQYETPAGPWTTQEPLLLRLLHNDLSFVLRNLAGLDEDAPFVATSTNYGSNPYYCFRRPAAAGAPPSVFHLAQEDLCERHSALYVLRRHARLEIGAAEITFPDGSGSAIDEHGCELPPDALVLTAPALVWAGRFVGWRSYARATYDCRHVVALQYRDTQDGRVEERARAEIQRLQRLWPYRDTYVAEVLRAAERHGYGVYERLIIGVGSDAGGRFLALMSVEGTAAEAAVQALTSFPGLETALQISDGGGTGIVTGTLERSAVKGASGYRRGRVLCSLVLELSRYER